MKKLIISSIYWAIAMTIVFMIFWVVEMQIFWSNAYIPPLFIDYSENMSSFFIYFVILKLFHSFLLSYLHEKIPRCWSSLWTKTWRFSWLAFLLVFGPWIWITALTMPVWYEMLISWLINWYLQTFLASLIIIHTLYRYPANSPSLEVPR